MINVLRTKLFPHCHTTALFRKLRIYTVDWFYPEYCSHIQWLNVGVCVHYECFNNATNALSHT